MTTVKQTVSAIIEKHSLLKHPFYQAWSRGELTLDILRDYAEQYYAQVGTFPRFVSTVHSGCPDIETRKVLVENLADEEIHGVDHPELWVRFAEGVGAQRASVKDVKPTEATREMVDTFFSLAKKDWKSGLCALYAYEAQVPEVAASKIEGLKAHYGISDDRSLAFFKVHQHYDVEHAAKVLELIEKHCDVSTAADATEEAARALTVFLDGMCAKHHIACA